MFLWTYNRYCNQVLSKEIDECVTLLLQELVSFQERIYQKDPMRAKARRRLVMGLREVTKHMKLNKIKCVIISPNCEKIQSKGIINKKQVIGLISFLFFFVCVCDCVVLNSKVNSIFMQDVTRHGSIVQLSVSTYFILFIFRSGGNWFMRNK